MSDSFRPRVGFVLERSLGHVTHAENLIRLLPQQDDIEAVLLPVDFAVEGWAAHLPVYNSNWTVRAGWRAARAIRRAQTRAPLDALFIHTQVPAVLSQRWMRRIPTVVSLDATPMQYDELGQHYGHSLGHPRIERLKYDLNRACLQRAARLVTWSDWAKHGLVDGYGVRSDQVVVIPPGATQSLWANRVPRVEDGGPVRVLFVGGDLRRKGGDLLIDASTRLRAELGSNAVELHLVTRSRVEPSEGVHVHCGLGPNSPELILLYHRSHIFCLPTRGDSHAIVLSEAGATGLPAVVTAIAGIPEVVRDGETGLVVPVDDVGALTIALRRLVDDPHLRQRLGEAARRRIAADFDAEKNVRKIVDVVTGIARQRTAPAT